MASSSSAAYQANATAAPQLPPLHWNEFGLLDGLGADRDAADEGDPVLVERVDAVAEHVDAAEHRRHPLLDELLTAGGRSLGGELGVADLDLDRAAVHPAQLVVDELDAGLTAWLSSG